MTKEGHRGEDKPNMWLRAAVIINVFVVPHVIPDMWSAKRGKRAVGERERGKTKRKRKKKGRREEKEEGKMCMCGEVTVKGMEGWRKDNDTGSKCGLMGKGRKRKVFFFFYKKRRKKKEAKVVYEWTIREVYALCLFLCTVRQGSVWNDSSPNETKVFRAWGYLGF